tara:strand:- start:617 stop:910 length:294 start_codon:yes stop_codon:yes gene_type:complete
MNVKIETKRSNRYYFASFMVFLLVFLSVLFYANCLTAAPPSKSKFYNFENQVIDGEIKKPTTLYTNSRKKVEFERLLNLKKSFLPDLLNTSKDKAFK